MHILDLVILLVSDNQSVSDRKTVSARQKLSTPHSVSRPASQPTSWLHQSMSFCCSVSVLICSNIWVSIQQRQLQTVH